MKMMMNEESAKCNTPLLSAGRRDGVGAVATVNEPKMEP